MDKVIVDQVLLDFLAADIREHAPVDFNARRQRLSAFRLHLPTKRRILDDVLLGVGKIVFGENRAHTGAPAAIGLQISDNFGRLHLANIPPIAHEESIEAFAAWLNAD